MPVLTRRSSVSVGGPWAGKPLAWKSYIDDYAQHDVIEAGGHLYEAFTDVPPGCAPLGAGDGSAADRDFIVSQAMGYGRFTTGGYSYPTLTVTNGDDDGAGSLRQACDDALAAGGGWIIGNEDIVLDPGPDNACIQVPNNTTLDLRGSVNGSGVGSDSPILYMGGAPSPQPALIEDLVVTSWNVILNGFAMNTGWASGNNADMLRFDFGAYNWWLRHLDLTNDAVAFPGSSGDEVLNVGRWANSGTMSWCKVHEHYKALIYGTSTASYATLNIGITVTNEHNWIDHISDRSSLFGGLGTGHLLNNVISNWGGGGGAASLNFSKVLSSGNIYDPDPAQANKRGLKNDTVPSTPGYVRSVGDWVKEDATMDTPNDSAEVLEPPYSYVADVADATLQTRVESHAGVSTLWELVA